MSKSHSESSKVVKDFALGTSCHGLSHIYSNKNRKIKVLWTALVLAVLGLLIWQVSELNSCE